MKLVKYLSNLGYGSRREVARLLEEGRVRGVDGRTMCEGNSFTHDMLRVDDEPLDPAPGSVVVLHKPAGYVCSTTDASPLVYSLLPARFRRRAPLIAPVGRLDRDTSGMLLLTDDGQLNHRITSPRTHLPKVYEARLAAELRGDETALFASGALVLESDSAPVRPAPLEVIGARHVRVTLTEGRYHQVRRMFAAAGNHVETLHRTAVGSIALGDLPVGRWRKLTASELARLHAEASAR